MGKDRPAFVRHMNSGEYVVVVNAEKVHVTGKKLVQKMYYLHSGYHGGLREETMETVLAHNPTRIIHDAVRGMLPKNTLAIHMLTRLKLVVGGSADRYKSQITGSAKAVEKAVKQAAEAKAAEAAAPKPAPAAVVAEPAKAAAKAPRPSAGPGRAKKAAEAAAPEIKLAKPRAAKAAEIKATEKKPKAEAKSAGADTKGDKPKAARAKKKEA
jgi:ribosomal protein L13